MLNDLLFMDVLQLFGLRDLSLTGYPTDDILSAFVERWKLETSSFHFPHGEMFIALDNVSCLLHLLIRRRLLDHNRINKDETLVMLIN